MSQKRKTISCRQTGGVWWNDDGKVTVFFWKPSLKTLALILVIYLQVWAGKNVRNGVDLHWILTDGKAVNCCSCRHRKRLLLIGIHRTAPNKKSTFISFPYTQSHSFTQSLLCLPRTCTYSQLNNQTLCAGGVTAASCLNQEISLHW